MKKLILIICSILSFITTSAQINTDRVMMIGRNALYFEDYVLAIQYFNQIIKTKPYLAEPYYYRAVAKYFLDDFKGAEEDCTLSIEKNQFLYGAYQLRADSRQNQKNYKGAEEDYEMSLRQNPNDKFILINLGIVNIENKDLDKAETYLNQLVKTYPGFTEGTLTRANLYLEKADTIKAIDNINKAIENDKYFAPGYAMRASVNLMKKQYENAIEDYNKTIELDPLGTGYYINRGLAKYYTNDLRGAMSDYDHVIKTDPNSLIAHFNRALLRAQVGDDNKAIEDLNFVIKNEPDNYIAYMNRALLKTNTGDLRGSLNDLNKVLAEYPNFYQGYQFRSDIKRRQNDMRGAEQDYNTAVRIENKVKQDVLAGKTPQGIDEGTKTREESDKTIDKFNLLVVSDKDKEEKNIYKSETRGKIQNKQANIDLMPIFIVSYYDDANSNSKNFIHFNKELEDLNKNTILNQKLIITNHDVQLDSIQIAERFESINSFSNLITKQPENAVLYFARGLDYMLIQDYSSAIEDFNKSIAIDPSFTLAYFNLGSAYEKMLNAKLDNPELYQSNKTNAYNSVNQQYQNINNGLINTTAPANNEDANLLISKIENDQIIDSYNKVLEISPDFIYAYYNRAEIKSMQNDIRGAILDYNEAIRKDPDFADAYYNRGINRLKINDTQRGLEDLRKAGELGIVSAYSIMKRMTE